MAGHGEVVKRLPVGWGGCGDNDLTETVIRYGDQGG